MSHVIGRISSFLGWKDTSIWPDNVKLEGWAKHFNGRTADVAALFAGLSSDDETIGSLLADVTLACQVTGEKQFYVVIRSTDDRFRCCLTCESGRITGYREDLGEVNDMGVRGVKTIAQMLDLLAPQIDKALRAAA